MEENNQSSNVVSPVSPVPQTPPIQTPPIQTPPILKTKSKLPLLIVGIFIFLFLAGGAAAGYVYREPLMKLVSKPTPTPTLSISPTPTPDPTANWKTYQGDGYSFKYPADIGSEKCPNGLAKTSLCSDKQGTGTEPLFYFVTSNYEDQLPQSGSDVKVTFKQQLINGIQTYRTTDLPSQNGEDIVYFKNSNGKYTSIFLSPHSNTNSFPNEQKYESLFTQILSTFKFTNDKKLVTKLDPSSVLKSSLFIDSKGTKREFVIYSTFVSGSKNCDSYITEANFMNAQKIDNLSWHDCPDNPSITVNVSPGQGKKYITVMDNVRMSNTLLVDENGNITDNFANGAAIKAVVDTYGPIGQSAAGFEKWIDNHTYTAKVWDANGYNYQVTIDAITNKPVGKVKKL